MDAGAAGEKIAGGSDSPWRGFSPSAQKKSGIGLKRRWPCARFVGAVKLEGVSYGQDRRDGHWGSPAQERGGLSAHQELSPALEDKLAFTVTTTQSYQAAAEVSCKWGSPVSDSTVPRLTQRLGAKA